MFYLGGNAGKSNIEVHDIQFAAVERPEDAWDRLRAAWFGDKDKVHLDGYSHVSWADGYDVVLSSEPADSDMHLYFVNVGGYRLDSLAELHEFDFFVARDAQGAKAKALETLLTGASQKHKDNLKDVDNCLLMDKVGDFHIHLCPNPHGRRWLPAWQGYQPIGI
jgi:hypothetical protein